MSKLPKNKVSKNLNVEDVYKSVSLHQHILAAPDTYIGATTSDEIKMFVVNDLNVNGYFEKPPLEPASV